MNIHLSGQRAGEAVPAAAGEDGELQQLSQRMSTQMHLSDTGVWTLGNRQLQCLGEVLMTGLHAVAKSLGSCCTGATAGQQR